MLIDRFEEPAEGAPTRIFASILVDHDSQKPIVVGRGGEMIKRIGTEARRDLETMLDGRVYLLAAARAGRTRLIDNVVLEGDPL